MVINGHLFSVIRGPRPANLDYRISSGNDSKVVQLGRSMIEMLGVLAIIAVLSVGGIAGYSKAMEMWKINKAIDDYKTMIFGLLEHFDSIRKPLYNKNSGDTGMADIIQGLDLIPTSWQKINNSRFADSYGNYINIFYRSKGVNDNRLIIDMWLGGFQENSQGSISSAFSNKLCIQLYLNLAQPLHRTLHFAGNYRQGKNGSNFVPLFGDAYCQTGRYCLSQMTVQDFYNFCNSCQKDSEICTLTLSFTEFN